METAFEVYILQKGNTLHKKYIFFKLIKNQLILILIG